MYEIRISDCEKFCLSVLVHYKVPPSDAQTITDVIMDSELRGYDDHGLFFLKGVANFGYESGSFNPIPNVRVIRDDGSTALVDGDRACGSVAAKFAMNTCIDRARRHGIAAVGVRNSGNIVAPAVFVLDAASAGMFGFCASNIAALIAPIGGTSRTLGTNPFAYAAPTRDPEVPFLFDMACSSVAAAKIAVAAQEGRDVGPDLIQDSFGKPSTDPFDFLGPDSDGMVTPDGGTVLPAGGAKGYGLAVVIDILCGVLTGAHFGIDLQLDNVRENRNGLFVFVIDIQRFQTLASFTERMANQATGIKSGGRKENVDEILLPGERGLRLKAARTRIGTIEVNEGTWKAMKDLKESTGVVLPSTI